jgi:EpsI family protein
VVGVHISYYSQQDASRKLVSSSNALVTSDNRTWLRLSSANRMVQLADAKALTISASELRPRAAAGVGQESNLVVWRFYWVDGQLTSSDVVAKLYGAWGRFMGRPDDAAAIFLYAQRGARGEVESVLERFTRDNLAPLQTALVESRDRRTSTEK